MSIKSIVIYLGILLLLLVSAVFFLISTEPGTAIIMKSASAFAPGPVSYRNISGTLMKKVTINGIEYTGDEFSIYSSTISFRINLIDLFRKKFTASSIRAGDLSYTNFPSGSSIQARGIAIQPLSIKTDRLNARLRWETVLLEDDGETTVSLSEGSITAAGPFDEYSITGNTKLTGTNIPETSLSIIGRGSRTGLTIERFGADLRKQGTLILKGSVFWSPDFSWDLTAQGTGINPAIIDRNWQGDLVLEIESNGKIDDHPSWTVEVHTVSGTLRGKEFSGTADLRRENNKKYRGSLFLTSGSVRATAQGSAGETIDISFRVNAEEINDLIPQIAGPFFLEGSVEGPASDPSFNVTAVASPNSTGFIRTGNISAGLTGRKSAHHLEIQALINTATGHMTLSGSMTDMHWTGTITEIFISTGTGSAWELTRPVDLAVSTDSITMSVFMLSGEDSSFSFEGNAHTNGRWNADVTIHALPLSLFTIFLPPHVTVHGLINGRGRGFHDGNETVITSTITVLPGYVRYVSAIPSSFHFEQSVISVSLKNKRLSVKTDLNLEAGSTVDFSGTASPATVPLNDPSIDANLNARIHTLSFLPIIFPRIADARGDITVDIQA
ncbi:MAG: hypothetical protein GF384_09040, partial [Elusimicrobia bacterium]|nr:hypothetical protein [Elusimicrobiota bacterium]